MTNIYAIPLPGDEGFDDYWFNLHLSDPIRCEQEKRAVIENYISTTPSEKQDSLRRLHINIDLNLAKETSQLARLLRSSLMLIGDSSSDAGLIPLYEKLDDLKEELLEYQILADQLPENSRLSASFLETQEAVVRIKKF